MSKVIICANLVGKLHLTSFSFSLSNIIIHLLIITIVLGFIIIFPTLTIITSFLLIPSWWLATIWVGQRLHEDTDEVGPPTNWLKYNSFIWFVTEYVDFTLADPKMPSA